jgi:flagellar hook protein FlgE
MGFATALSGLKAASTNLQVTGNNIANSQTVGFKESRAEFADVYASSFGGVSRTQPGSGVKVTEVAQQFKDGNIDPTSNSLDLALSGNGFFVLADEVNLPDPANPTVPVDPSVPTAYTRNGAFKLDSEGNVVNSQGKYLLAFAANGTTAAEGFSVGVFRPLTIDTSQGLPKATESVNLELTVNGAANLPTVAAFDPTDAKSYTHTTSVTTYDSQGNAHIAATYYVKTAVANTWDAYLFIDGFGITSGGQAVPPAPATGSTVTGAGVPGVPGAPVPLTFTSSGALDSVAGVAGGTKVDFGDIDLTGIDPNLGVDNLTFSIDYAKTTLTSLPFSVNNSGQDGLPAGNLTGIDIDGTGVVFARYSNGGSKTLGQVALARFQSNQSLAKLGDTSWAKTSNSGAPIYGAAGDNNFGDIQSSALESSTVDLSEQLVKLIVAQQAYQANSQTITTEKTLVETILRA